MTLYSIMASVTDEPSCKRDLSTEYKYICTCCHNPFSKKYTVYFKEENYNENVQKGLSNWFKDIDVCEVICCKCHYSLHKDNNVLPKSAAHLHRAPTVTCVRCQNDFNEELTVTFDQNNYNESSTQVTKIVLNMKDSKCTHRICNKCNAALLHQCLVICTLCKKEVKKYSAYRCHTNTDNESNDEYECTKEKKWMCKECNSRVCGKMKCAVCNGKYSRHYTLKVTLSKYDMANELVRT